MSIGYAVNPLLFYSVVKVVDGSLSKNCFNYAKFELNFELFISWFA